MARPLSAPVLTLAVLTSSLLASCSSVNAVYTLNFRPGPAGGEIDPATLLQRQVVPSDRLVSMAEAFRRAPEGAVILTCWKNTDITNFWGPCSHITRKYAPDRHGNGQVVETYNFSRPLAGVYPQRVEYRYYAVIVLDTGVTPALLPAMWTAAHALDGSFYALSDDPGFYYCSTYQNALQRAVGLQDAVPLNPVLHMALPADALRVKGVKVLWVGLNRDSPAAYQERPGQTAQPADAVPGASLGP